jgi:hypothetical protein
MSCELVRDVWMPGVPPKTPPRLFRADGMPVDLDMDVIRQAIEVVWDQADQWQPALWLGWGRGAQQW